MAEHRAAVNALHSLFLVKGDLEDVAEDEGGLAGLWRRNKRSQEGGDLKLPTESHEQWALEGGKVGKGLLFQGGDGWAGADVVVESGKRVVV